MNLHNLSKVIALNGILYLANVKNLYLVLINTIMVY